MPTFKGDRENKENILNLRTVGKRFARFFHDPDGAARAEAEEYFMNVVLTQYLMIFIICNFGGN